MSIGSHQWQKISQYLDLALAIEEDERPVWLNSLGNWNPELRAELQAFVDEYRILAGNRFLEKSPLPIPGAPASPGQIVGAYTLLSEIGRGGMGSVWLAERSDGRFMRRVAVKFLHAGLVGRGGEQRFRREGSILGHLVHPHIAELIDAGVTRSGQPYLILEYVEGEHIDRHCDRYSLSIEARVRLFLEVLEAVAHAHRNLIVHRDIKPSNVLVGRDGRVKLLDFGIAKLLEGEAKLGPFSVTAGENERPMTPEYAAPEQLKNGAVTTGTDVYGLGVLLYVLLTGQHPAGNGPHSHADLVKSIVETDPALPSETVGPLRAKAEFTTTNAAKRGATADKLHRTLRGDLDTIVMKAIKKDPQERYVSAIAFADDLRRYLQNKPIAARPDSLAYRAAKFVDRNRVATALAALALIIAAAGLTTTLVQARTARMQRDFALRQLLRREAVNEFNNFLLSDAAPSGKPLTVDELLGRAEQIVERQHMASEAPRVELLVSIGDQYSTQDDDAKARHVLEEAYELSRNLTEKSTRAQASCALAGALARDGDLRRAEILFQEGLRELPAESQYALDRTLCFRRGSEVAQERGDAEEGIRRMRRAQKILRESPFDSEVQELHVSMDLAEAYRTAGRNQQAASTFEQAAKLLSALGRDDTQTGVVLFNDWALALDRLGQPLAAEKLFVHAINLSRIGETDDTVSPVVLNNYAKTLRQLGQLQDAAEYAERAYSRAVKLDNRFAIYQSLYVRALVYIDEGNLNRAAAMLVAVEPLLRRTFTPDNYWFAALNSAQALVAEGRGDAATASRLADRAVNITEAAIQAGGEGIDFLPIVLLRRAAIRLANGRADEAAEDSRRALSMLQKESRPEKFSAYAGRAYLLLGRALKQGGKDLEARAAFQTALKHLQETLGADHPDTRLALRLAAET